MPKLAKEIILGFIPVLLVFLVFIGVNIVPLLIAGGLVGALLFLLTIGMILHLCVMNLSPIPWRM